MKVMLTHSNAGEKNRIGFYARQLLRRRLESYNDQIRLVTIKVAFNTCVFSELFDYHCLIKIFLTQGSEIKTEASDCDEILSIYKALDKAINIIENQSRMYVKN